MVNAAKKKLIVRVNPPNDPGTLGHEGAEGGDQLSESDEGDEEYIEERGPE